METIKFYVKEKSIIEFFKNRIVVSNDSYSDGYIKRKCDEELNVYHIFKDEILLKKSDDLIEGEKIKFELADASQISRKELINNYTYKIEKYDDVCVKLVLIEFNITTKL